MLLLICVFVFVLGWLAGIATANEMRDRRVRREGTDWLITRTR